MQQKGKTTRKRKRKAPCRSVGQRMLRLFVGVAAGLIVLCIGTTVGLWYFGLLPAREELPQFSDRLLAYFANYRHTQLPQAEVIGIDISHYQSYIQWDEVCFHYDRRRRLYAEPSEKTRRKDVDFVVAKATQGARFRDAFYRRNKAGAAEQQILFGAYHFYSAGVSAKAQADNFIRTANLQKGDLVPVLDVEPYRNRLPAVDSVVQWLRIVEKYYGARPIIYTNEDCYRRFFGKSNRFRDYHFWIARYGGEEPAGMHLVWQCSESGTVGGIAGPVDIDVFRGSLQELQHRYTLH